MKLPRIITLFLLLIVLISCEDPVDKNVTWYENKLAVSNIDGDSLVLIMTVDYNDYPYFVTDANNGEEEMILLDRTYSIDLMNINGTNQRTVIDSLGGVANFNKNRTKMLLNAKNDIYIANVDGTDLINLTNTPHTTERYPSFSLDESKVIYSVITLDSIGEIKEVEINSLNKQTLFYRNYEESEIDWIVLSYPTYATETSISFVINSSHGELDDFFTTYDSNYITYNLSSSTMEITMPETDIRKYFADKKQKNILLFEDNTVHIWNNETQSNVYSLHVPSLDTYRNNHPNPWSYSGRYVVFKNLLYDLNINKEIELDTKRNDLNREETKIIGVYRLEHQDK